MERNFAIAVQKTIAETKKVLVRTAKREHAIIMRTSPQPVTFTRFVDGRKGAPEETVNPFGVIVYQYPRLDVVVEFALETLRRLSPVRSGLYRSSHTLYLNGTPVSNLSRYRSGDQIIIGNPLPYARKIEVGSMKMRVPGQIYERAVRAVNRRYGNVAKAVFNFRGFISGSVVSGRAGNKSALRYPVMQITER